MFLSRSWKAVTILSVMPLLAQQESASITGQITDASGAIVPGAKVRDGDISKSDYFGILFDTYHDRQNGFVFTTTPAAM